MKINENQKITLTIGQLKRLVKESKIENDLRDKILSLDNVHSFEKWLEKQDIVDLEDFGCKATFTDLNSGYEDEISDINCNGSMTWGRAANILKYHFKYKNGGKVTSYRSIPDSQKNKRLNLNNANEFIVWAEKQGIIEKEDVGVEIGFMDFTGMYPSEISGINCDGTTTWGEAANLLKKHFR